MTSPYGQTAKPDTPPITPKTGSSALGQAAAPAAGGGYPPAMAAFWALFIALPAPLCGTERQTTSERHFFCEARFLSPRKKMDQGGTRHPQAQSKLTPVAGVMSPVGDDCFAAAVAKSDGIASA
ncbi:hypothetical protein [Stenotrophomonas chelatiphaga]|uniref:hypothetical protein n=1 Tax=Stenotrophomonas chelatiphaga TaxID=517011 RepID=UPI00128F9029|nr:hypothetical protein [Stenotrophomonas chelatiphaga]